MWISMAWLVAFGVINVLLVLLAIYWRLESSRAIDLLNQVVDIANLERAELKHVRGLLLFYEMGQKTAPARTEGVEHGIE